MPFFGQFECDIIDSTDYRTLRTIHLSTIPRVGEELDLDLGKKPGGGVYLVVRIRYHVRPRALVRTDDLFGVSIFVDRAV